MKTRRGQNLDWEPRAESSQGSQAQRGFLAQARGAGSLRSPAAQPSLHSSRPVPCPAPLTGPAFSQQGWDDKEPPGCLGNPACFPFHCRPGALPAVAAGPFVAIGIPRPQIMMTNSPHFRQLQGWLWPCAPGKARAEIPQAAPRHPMSIPTPSPDSLRSQESEGSGGRFQPIRGLLQLQPNHRITSHREADFFINTEHSCLPTSFYKVVSPPSPGICKQTSEGYLCHIGGQRTALDAFSCFFQV